MIKTYLAYNKFPKKKPLKCNKYWTVFDLFYHIMIWNCLGLLRKRRLKVKKVDGVENFWEVWGEKDLKNRCFQETFLHLGRQDRNPAILPQLEHRTVHLFTFLAKWQKPLTSVEVRIMVKDICWIRCALPEHFEWLIMSKMKDVNLTKQCSMYVRQIHGHKVKTIH